MALRDQPYLPLYIQDFMTDEKLIECSASATGVYIRLMCIMHKSKEYGSVLLKQKYKQSDKQTQNFALQLDRQMPYSIDEIANGLNELISEEVIIHSEGKLTQPRMVKDNDISLKRSEAGKKGGESTQLALAKEEAKPQANSENEYETEFINEFNKIKDSKFQKTEKVKRQLSARFKEGYSIKEILTATKSCFEDDFHRKNPKYLTPEFITRSDKLQKYLNNARIQDNQGEQQQHNSGFNPATGTWDKAEGHIN